LLAADDHSKLIASTVVKTCSPDAYGGAPFAHLLRSIDRYFDLSELRHHLAPFYSHIGRPLIDPELMIRMLINVRSVRRPIAT